MIETKRAIIKDSNIIRIHRAEVGVIEASPDESGEDKGETLIRLRNGFPIFIHPSWIIVLNEEGELELRYC